MRSEAVSANTDGIVTRDLYEAAALPVAQKPGVMALLGSVLIGALLDLIDLGTVPSICLAAVSFPLLLAAARKSVVATITSETIKAGEDKLREFPTAPPVMIDLAAVAARRGRGTALTGAVYDGSWFYLIEDGVVARIPIRMIRNWTWKIEGHRHCAAAA